jgi:hypothetical protein
MTTMTCAAPDGEPAGGGFLELGNEMLALPALQALSAAARDLLARTAQLPAGERELLGVLTEYRHAVFAFAAVAEKL